MSDEETVGTRAGWPGVLAVALVALLGVINLPTPFTGDQALFATAARMMSHGAEYYRDFWDIKQPGIMLFFQGGLAIHDGPVGVHVLELAWFVAFALAMLRALRLQFRSAGALALAPVFAIGSYLAVIGPTGQTLIEGIVGFPLFIAMAAASRVATRPETRLRWALLAGLATGVVAVFKVVLIAIALWFWLVALIRLIRQRSPVSDLLMTGAMGLLGVGIIVGPFVVHYTDLGIGALVWKTTFVWPPQISRLAGMHDRSLFVSLVGAGVRRYGWLAILAIAGLVRAVRAKRVTPLHVDLLGWVGVGLAVLLTQKWNGYQVTLLVVPLGVLAALAVDDVLARSTWREARHQRAVVAVAAITLVAALIAAPYFGVKGRNLATNEFAIGAGHEEAYRFEASGEYGDVLREVGRVGPEPFQGRSLYVLGHPLYYEALRRPQALPQNGWSPEQWLDVQWATFVQQLTDHPPDVLLVDYQVDPLLDAHPAARRAIDARYEEFSASPADQPWGGHWLRRR